LESCSALAPESLDFSEIRNQASDAVHYKEKYVAQPELIQVNAESDSALICETLDLYEKIFTDDCELTRNELAAAIEQGRYIVLVFPNGSNKIKGFAIVGHLKSYDSTFCLLDYFAVSPEFRGNGYGGKMFEMVVQYIFDSTRYNVVLLECEQQLITWYEKFKAKRVNISPSKCEEKEFHLMQVTRAGCSVNHESQACSVLAEIHTVLHCGLQPSLP
jgi:ribosomal protein S18 acetylase RimI-like enzyme